MSSSLTEPRRSSRRLTMTMTPSLTEFSPIIKRRTIAPTDSMTKKAVSTPKTPLLINKEIQSEFGDVYKISVFSNLKLPAPKPNIPQETPKTQYLNPIMAKLQKDLNSPSAAARIRANKAIKSPNFRNKIYGAFDVPHERQDLVTEEERKPVKPKTIPEIFAGCKVYVEVRTGDDNRSAGIKNRLVRDGIPVNDKLYKDTTHCIFKDGLLSTYKNAVKAGIPVINILWIDACISQGRLADTTKFKISNLDRYEHPELYKRMRRQKSMQPDISSMKIPERKKSMTQEETPKRLESSNETIVEQEDESGMELTLQNTSTSITAVASMEVATPMSGMDRMKQQYRRLTTFTPDAMEQTGFLAKMAIDRRRTLFTPQLSKKSDETLTPENSNVFSHDSSKTIVFNSANRIGKSTRRSVFDISMNLLEMNCKALKSSQESEDTVGSAKKRDPPSAIKTVEKSLLTQVVPQTGVVRKRKLFNCDSEEIDDGKENLNKSLKMPEKVLKLDKTLQPAIKTPQPVKKAQPQVDRRRTMTFFKTEKPKELPGSRVKTPAKSSVAIKYIVCTNMSSTDKHIIHAVSSDTFVSCTMFHNSLCRQS